MIHSCFLFSRSYCCTQYHRLLVWCCCLPATKCSMGLRVAV